MVDHYLRAEIDNHGRSAKLTMEIRFPHIDSSAVKDNEKYSLYSAEGEILYTDCL